MAKPAALSPRHGVSVEDDGGERWSWILWYRDDTSCVDHGASWFRACADAGSAVCQSRRAGSVFFTNEMQTPTQSSNALAHSNVRARFRCELDSVLWNGIGQNLSPEQRE